MFLSREGTTQGWHGFPALDTAQFTLKTHSLKITLPCFSFRMVNIYIWLLKCKLCASNEKKKHLEKYSAFVIPHM